MVDAVLATKAEVEVEVVSNLRCVISPLKVAVTGAGGIMKTAMIFSPL
jgi:hypothetical protein